MKGTICLVALIFAVTLSQGGKAQVSQDEAMARLRAKATQPTTQGNSDIARLTVLHNALIAAQAQIDSLRDQNAKLRADLMKAQNPAAQEQAWLNANVEVGMTRSAAEKIFDVSNWQPSKRKTEEFIGRLPIEVQVWSREEINPRDFKAVQIDPRTTAIDSNQPKPGQPKSVVIINDVVIYVSPK